jgi:hypothetical protein
MAPDTISLNELKTKFTALHIAQAEKTVERLHNALPNKAALHENKVALLFGGGKDSSWMAAYTRLVQLMMQEEYGDTFTLRSFTAMHSGMQKEVLENVDSVYRKLGMYNDPLVETLVINNNDVSPFNAQAPMLSAVRDLNRTDVLMNGHRFSADARRTFCDSCNRNVANWQGVAAAYDDGADIVITGDSKQEAKTYMLWLEGLRRKMGTKRTHGKGAFSPANMLSAMDELGQKHTADIHGDDPDIASARRVTHALPKSTQIFTIFDEAKYSAKDHLKFLTDFLGIKFDSLMFSFTETDCGNPALMAHMWGLRAERLFPGHRYAEGVMEYRDYALDLMAKKHFPDELIGIMRERYKDEEAVNKLRPQVEQYAQDAYNLTPEQLVTMVFSPFTGSGTNLHVFLEREHADLLSQERHIRELLSKQIDDERLAARLNEMSGLTLGQLRRCYEVKLVHNPLAADHPTDSIGDRLRTLGDGDPHQGEIKSVLVTAPKNMVTKIGLPGGRSYEIPQGIVITGR